VASPDLSERSSEILRAEFPDGRWSWSAPGLALVVGPRRRRRGL